MGMLVISLIKPQNFTIGFNRVSKHYCALCKQQIADDSWFLFLGFIGIGYLRHMKTIAD